MYELRLVRIEAYGSGDVETVAEVAANWVDFTPRGAPVDTTYTRGAGAGALPIAATVRNVEETLTLWYPRPLTGLQQFNQALETARLWALSGRRDMRLCVQVRNPDRNPHWYMAQLYGGVAEPNGAARTVTVRRTREPYWRGIEST